MICPLRRAVGWLRDLIADLEDSSEPEEPWPPADDLVARLLLAEARLEDAEAEVARLRSQLELRGRSA